MDGFEARGYDAALLAQLPELMGAHFTDEAENSPVGLSGFAFRFVEEPVAVANGFVRGSLLVEASTPGGTLAEGEEARTVLRRVLRAEMLAAQAEGREFHTFTLRMQD